MYDLRAMVFPERCPYCNTLIEAHEVACDSCFDILCEKHIPLIGGAGGFRCVSTFLYGGRVRRAIINMKFHDRIQYIPQFSELIAQDIERVYAGADFDLITAVPMHEKDIRERGYNQSELLAKALSKRLGIPYLDTLDKVKRTKKQHRLTYTQRKKNLSGAFKLKDRDAVHEKRILLIDDIVTSGTTLGVCGKALSLGKPARICCATIAAARNYYPEATII